jgi:hypothetical protein
MEILKMAHFTFLAIFHLKMSLCQILNLPHTYGHYFENKLIFYMIIIKIFTWFTNLLQSQIHYDMNSNLKMFTKKLQLLAFVVICNE